MTKKTGKPQAFPTAVNDQITDSVTQSAAPCEHQQVMTWVFDDGVPAMWSCAKCKVKFVPLTQLNAEVAAEREKRKPLTPEQYMMALGPLAKEIVCSAGTLRRVVQAIEQAQGIGGNP